MTWVGGEFARREVRVDLRRIIAAESASNDGLAYPFLSISIYLTVEASRREAAGKWFLVGVLCMFYGLLSTVHSELTLVCRPSHSWHVIRCCDGWVHHTNGFPVPKCSVGYGFRRLLNFSYNKGLAKPESFVVQYLALALFTVGIASSLGMDDLLAAFAAGMRGLRLPIFELISVDFAGT